MTLPTAHLDRGWDDREGDLVPLTSNSGGEEFAGLAGDEDVERARALLRKHTGRLRGYLNERFGPPLGGGERVEELVGDVVDGALRDRSAYDPEQGTLGFWLFTLGVALACDRLRASFARGDVQPGSDRMRKPELREAVLAAIGRLQGRGRTILLLDLEYGGRAPAGILAEKLEVETRTIFEERRMAREKIEAELRELLGDEQGS